MDEQRRLSAVGSPLYGTAGDIQQEPLLGEVQDITEPHSEHDGISGIPFSIFNLLNTMVGGGTIAMPFAFRSAGLGFSVLIMVIIMIFSAYTQLILIICQRKSKKFGHTYEDIGRCAFGEFGVKFTQITEIGNTFGVLCAYLVIIADQSKILNEWLSSDFILLRSHSKLFLLVCVIVIILPLSVGRNISFLNVPSMLSMFLILFTGIAVTIRGVMHLKAPHVQHCDISWFNLDSRMLYALPVITLGFTSHINACHIFHELKRSSLARWQIVNLVSMCTAFVFYCCVGVFGYLTFCDTTPGDILLAYGKTPLIQAARVVMLCSFALSYPLLLFPNRNAVQSVFFGDRPFTWTRHLAITITVIILTYAIAISVPFVAPIFSLVGAITATSLTFVLPTLFYLKIEDGPLTSLKKLPALVVLVVGTLFGVSATAGVIYNITQGNVGS